MSDGFKVIMSLLLTVTVLAFLVLGSLNDSASKPDYGSYETSRSSEESETFEGYSCTSDCSGHEAGYDWAERNDVCDTEYDGGNSDSFAEGVRAYAEEEC